MNSDNDPSGIHVQPRPEYPRPNFVRDEWLNLNGPWRFRSDPDDLGLQQHWFEGFSEGDPITVPFAAGSQASGIAPIENCKTVWYCRALPPIDWNSDAILLNIGAADHATSVWINGQHLLDHRGGYTPIQATSSRSLITTATSSSFESATPRHGSNPEASKQAIHAGQLITTASLVSGKRYG